MKISNLPQSKLQYQGMEVSSKAMVLNESPIRGVTRVGEPTQVGRILSNKSLRNMFNVTPTKNSSSNINDDLKKNIRPTGF